MNQKPDRQQLARGALGQAEVLFQAVAHLGPAGAAIVIFPFLTHYVGAAVPFLLAVCLVAVLLTALCVSSLARHLDSQAQERPAFSEAQNRGLTQRAAIRDLKPLRVRQGQ